MFARALAGPLDGSNGRSIVEAPGAAAAAGKAAKPAARSPSALLQEADAIQKAAFRP
jgi:hypothetical protein